MEVEMGLKEKSVCRWAKLLTRIKIRKKTLVITELEVTVRH